MNRFLYTFGYWLCRLMAVIFWRFRVIHRERVIEDGPVLIVANHESYLDPPLVGICFRRPVHFLARSTLFRGVLGWLLPRINVIPVDQGKADLSSMKKTIALLKGGKPLVFFPEGSRSHDGTLQRAQPGVGMVIAKSGVPVLPIRLFGAHEALPRGGKFPVFPRITAVVGEPVDFSDIEKSDKKGKELYQAYADRVMEVIGALEL